MASSLFARAGRRLYTSGTVVAHAGRRLYTSGSVSRTRQHHAAGSHLHRIEGYSLIDKNTRTGKSVTSMAFPVGRGLQWRLFFYPNGIDAANRGFVSAELMLVSGEFSFKDTTATYRVSILDRAGKPAHTATLGPCRYGGYESYDFSSWRDEEAELPGKKVIERLVSTEELRRLMSFLSGNDCLDVRCDVDVVDMYVDVEDMDHYQNASHPPGSSASAIFGPGADGASAPGPTGRSRGGAKMCQGEDIGTGSWQDPVLMRPL